MKASLFQDIIQDQFQPARNGKSRRAGRAPLTGFFCGRIAT
jgi:hypothetical protein